MNAARLRSRAPLAAAFLIAASPFALAGVSLNPTPGKVMHPAGYTGTGGELVVNVCLDPAFPPASGNPAQAIQNVIAEYNRHQGRLGNVENAATNGVPPAATDFESMLMHELGHCTGLDHNVYGPSEVGCSGGGCTNNAQLFYTNAANGANGVRNVDDGADNARATGDDLRGDDVNLHWYRAGVNNPFVQEAVADRNTFVQSGSLPGSDTFAEASTAFGPCAFGSAGSNTSSANGQPATMAVMFPVLCLNNVVRDLSPDDRNTLQVGRAGLDGTAGTGDDYTVRLQYQGTNTSGCQVRIQFPSGGGFFCQVSFTVSPNGDRRITSGTIKLQRETDWFFNQNDTTGGEPQANLAVTLSDGGASVARGNDIVFNVGASNAGPDTAANVVVAFPLPAGTGFVSGSGTGWSCANAAGTINCTRASLASGASAPLTIAINVPGGYAGPTPISTSVSISSDTTDPVPANNSASDTTPVVVPDPEGIFCSGFEAFACIP